MKMKSFEANHLDYDEIVKKVYLANASEKEKNALKDLIDFLKAEQAKVTFPLKNPDDLNLKQVLLLNIHDAMKVPADAGKTIIGIATKIYEYKDNLLKIPLATMIDIKTKTADLNDRLYNDSDPIYYAMAPFKILGGIMALCAAVVLTVVAAVVSLGTMGIIDLVDKAVAGVKYSASIISEGWQDAVDTKNIREVMDVYDSEVPKTSLDLIHYKDRVREVRDNPKNISAGVDENPDDNLNPAPVV